MGELQPRTPASSRYMSYQRRLRTECDSTRRPPRIFPTSLMGDVTSEIAEDDWERGWVNLSSFLKFRPENKTFLHFQYKNRRRALRYFLRRAGVLYTGSSLGDRSQNSLYFLNFSKLSSLINSKSFHFHPMINNVFLGGGGGLGQVLSLKEPLINMFCLKRMLIQRGSGKAANWRI